LCPSLVPLPLKPVSIGTLCTASRRLYTFSCLRSRSFLSLWRFSVHAVIARYLSPILPRLARSCHPRNHHRYNTHTAIPHLVTLPSFSSLALSVLSHPSSCLTPQQSHPFTCNPYIVTIIDLHSKKRPTFTAERTSLSLEPPLTYLVVPSAFALSFSFFILCQGI